MPALSDCSPGDRDAEAECVRAGRPRGQRARQGHSRRAPANAPLPAGALPPPARLDPLSERCAISGQTILPVSRFSPASVPWPATPCSGPARRRSSTATPATSVTSGGPRLAVDEGLPDCLQRRDAGQDRSQHVLVVGADRPPRRRRPHEKVPPTACLHASTPPTPCCSAISKASRGAALFDTFWAQCPRPPTLAPSRARRRRVAAIADRLPPQRRRDRRRVHRTPPTDGRPAAVSRVRRPDRQLRAVRPAAVADRTSLPHSGSGWPSTRPRRSAVFGCTSPSSRRPRSRPVTRGTLIDISTAFEEWMAAHEYRDAYFAESRTDAAGTRRVLRPAGRPRPRPGRRQDSDRTIIGLARRGEPVRARRPRQGLGADRTSARRVQGRLLVFFPGEVEGNSYRLLGARDGWNYLATLITATRKADP